MRLTSKIKQIFSDDLLTLLASVCDTKRIESAHQKMKLVGDLLFHHGIKWSFLGGATNRVVMFIEGYAVKVAIDSQGYRDNLIEYCICPELQPYVSKAYETNGYVLIAEYVQTMKQEDFITRKQDMLNILMALADDYLLGDVGYNKVNMTNWGIRSNGELVILDYAYVHRATETLFRCPVCGEGVLAYDHVFVKLRCTNNTVCHANFTYNDRKTDQGDQVDLDMIAEHKKISLVLSEGQSYIDVRDSGKGRLVYRDDGKTIIVVDNDDDYYEMKRKERKDMLAINFDKEDAFNALVKMAIAAGTGSDEEQQEAKEELENVECVEDSGNVEYEIDPDYESERIGRMEDMSCGVSLRGVTSEDRYRYDDAEDDDTSDFDAIVRKAVQEAPSSLMKAWASAVANTEENDDYQGEPFSLFLDDVQLV